MKDKLKSSKVNSFENFKLNEEHEDPKDLRSEVEGLISELADRKLEYQTLVDEMDIDNLDWQRTEDLGAYIGKVECLDMVIQRLKSII